MPVLARVSRVLRIFGATFTVLAVASSSSGQPAGRRLVRNPSAEERRVELPGSIGPHALRAESLGHLPGETPLTRMTLALRPTAEQDAQLTQLLADQQNPSSRSYHQWLTPEEFGARFGVPDADLQILENWVQVQGFKVESVARSRNGITFSGPAALAEQAFGTSLQRFRRNGEEFFENTSSVHLPASLSGVVSGLSGLSSYRLSSPRSKRASLAEVSASPQYTTSTGTHYIVPWDFRQIYGVNSLLSSGYDGTGVRIGVIGQSAVDPAQLTYFQQKTGQGVKLPTMVLVPYTSASAKVSGDEAESELDLEYASGVAPGASIQFIYTGCANASTGTCNNNGAFDALSYAIVNNLAPILSFSYGGCEAEDASYALSTLEPLLKQANAQGQTVVVSSGDNGPASCEQSANTSRASAGLAVSYPASSPYVTAVGGTQLNTDSPAYWSNSNHAGDLGSAAGYMPEIAWNDTLSYGSLTASGGGVSKIFSKPSWQAAPGVPNDGQRDVPDIAFAANVSEHAYLICDADDPCSSGSNGFVVGRDGGAVGGTSASAPNFAATMAIVEQAIGAGPLGNLNASLYGLAEGTTAASIFHDITAGNNVVACVPNTSDCTSGSIGYSAGAGYDLVTGLGSLSAAALQPALASYAATTASVALTLSPSAPTIGSPVTLAATVSAKNFTPTGTVVFSVDGTMVGTPVTLASGTAVCTYAGFTTSGAHTISAEYSGDSTYLPSTASLTETASLNLPIVAVFASPAAPVAGSAVSVTATVSGTSGTPTGAVSFSVDTDSTAASSMNLNNGSAVFSYPGFHAAGLHTVTVAYAGNAVYKPASTVATVTVVSASQTATPVVRLSITPSIISAGSSVSISTAVTGTGMVPTGTVSYSIDGNAVSTVTLVAGSAVSSYSGFITAGLHSVVATYSGDSTYIPGGASATVTVATPGITLAISPSAFTVSAGSNGSVTAVATSQNGFAGQITFKPTLVSSTGATFAGCYTLSPATVTLSSGGSASTTVNIFTSSSTCTMAGGITLAMSHPSPAPVQAEKHQSPTQPSTGSEVLFAGLLGYFAFKRRSGSPGLLIVLVFALAGGLSGCGSGVSSAATATVTSPASPALPSTKGTYVVQVTATSAADASIASSAPFTLNIP